MMIRSNTQNLQCHDTINKPTMEIFTVQEWENRFDELFERVEKGETIGVVREDGKAAVFMPADEADFLRIHTEDNNEAQ